MYMPDSIDEQLVRLLGQDGRQSSEALAKHLNISAATIRRRVRKLIKSGFLDIVGVIDPFKYGYAVPAVIGFNVVHSKIESTIETLIKRSEIIWVSTSTGRFDVIALALFSSTGQLSEFITKELAQIEGLKDTETYMCLDMPKRPHIVHTL
jgi:Lrp/AsnC family transcriptional regulator for asnA, asnC and gidA